MAESRGDVPEAVATPVVERARRISVVWIVPVVAILAGAWLAWNAFAELGPLVTITFESAEGLEEGRTTIKHKDVDVGTVESIYLSEDLSRVVVEARMARELEPYLTENARFWIVRARVSPGGVSGLTTLFSGVYIAVDPATEGERTNRFGGLEQPPAVFGDQPGRYFELHSPTLGAGELGTPVYFRDIRVGEVVDYELAEDGQSVAIRIFVREPYTRFVRSNSRFWSAGGVELDLGVDGLSFETPSLISLLVGGIAFDTPRTVRPGDQAADGSVFPLFPRRGDVEEDVSARKEYFLAYFDQSVRGLSRGAPVELQGIPIGQVVDVGLEYDAPNVRFRAPVLLEIQPERIGGVDELAVDARDHFTRLVKRGLRAQLQQGSLLTGQLFVNLEMFPDAEPIEIRTEGDYLVMPTRPSQFEELTSAISNLVSQLESMPLEEIGTNVNQAALGINELVNSAELQDSVASLAETLKSVQGLAEQLDAEVAPAVTAALDQTEKVLTNAQRLLSPDEPVQRELARVMREMAEAARSLRTMADYLEQHPEALIYGKEEP
jgi:paraquat-inducible protein B